MLEALRGLQHLKEGLERFSPLVHEPVLETLLAQRQNHFFHCICSRDPKALEEAVKDLVGFGVGLTPSGDDFLTGCLATLWFCLGPEDFLVEFLRRELMRHLDCTTFISAQMLRWVCQGRIRLSLLRLIAELCKGNLEAAELNLQALLQVGATSGHDMATGVRCALQSLLSTK